MHYTCEKYVNKKQKSEFAGCVSDGKYELPMQKEKVHSPRKL